MSYSSAVLALNPSAYYRLDDTGATAVDSSPNGLNGTIFNAPTQNVAGLLLNDADTAMQFTGVANQRIQAAALPVGNYTLVALVKPSGVPGSGVLLASASGFSMTLQGNALAWGTVNTNGTQAGAQGVLSAAGSVPSGSVTHVAIAVTNTSNAGGTHFAIKPYINGVGGTLINYGSIAPYSSGYPTLVGDFGLAAVLDEVAIFPGVLTDAQVAGLYQAAQGVLSDSVTITAGADIIRTATQHVSAGAIVLSGAVSAVIGAASRVVSTAFRSITANAVILSAIRSQSIDAGATISEQQKLSIGAASIITPITDNITIGAGAFIIPATVQIAIAAGALIGGLARAVISAGARILVGPQNSTIFVDRKVTVEPIQRVNAIDVAYRKNQRP